MFEVLAPGGVFHESIESELCAGVSPATMLSQGRLFLF